MYWKILKPHLINFNIHDGISDFYGPFIGVYHFWLVVLSVPYLYSMHFNIHPNWTRNHNNKKKTLSLVSPKFPIKREWKKIQQKVNRHSKQKWTMKAWLFQNTFSYTRIKYLAYAINCYWGLNHNESHGHSSICTIFQHATQC